MSVFRRVITSGWRDAARSAGRAPWRWRWRRESGERAFEPPLTAAGKESGLTESQDRSRAFVVLGLPLLVALISLAAGCGGDGGSVGEATPSPGDASEGVISRSLEPLDAEDPLLTRLELVTGQDQPIKAIEVFGSRQSGAPVAEVWHIYAQGLSEPLVLLSGEDGIPSEMVMPGGSRLKLEFEGDQAVLHYLREDGTYGVLSASAPPEALDTLDAVREAASQARAPGGRAGDALVTAYGGSRQDVPQVIAAPKAPTAPEGVSPPQVDLESVRREAEFRIAVRTADGKDLSRSICCFDVRTNGEKHTFNQMVRTEDGLKVTVVHEAAVETVLKRIERCEGPNWWLVGGLLAITVLGSAFGGPILASIIGGGAAGETTAAILAGLGFPLVGGIATLGEVTDPNCVQTVTQELAAEYRSRETEIEICPISGQIERFTPPCIKTTYRPWDPERPLIVGEFNVEGGVREDIAELRDCGSGEGVADAPPPVALDLDGAAAPGRQTAQELPEPFFLPDGAFVPCVRPDASPGTEEEASPAAGNWGVLHLEGTWLSGALCGGVGDTATVTQYHRSYYRAAPMEDLEGRSALHLERFESDKWSRFVCTFTKYVEGSSEYVLQNVSEEAAQAEFEKIKERTKDTGNQSDPYFWEVPESGDGDPVEVETAPIFRDAP